MLGGGLRTMCSQHHHWQIFVAKAEMGCYSDGHRPVLAAILSTGECVSG